MSGASRSRWRIPGICCVSGIGYLYLCLRHPEWLPRCLFRWLSGYDCPACGTQRACVHLLHGEFGAAFWQNPYVFVVLPYLLLVVVATGGRGASMLRLRRAVEHRGVVAAYALLMAAWWILRNTPWWHGLTR